MIEVTPAKFYSMGVYLFGIMAVMNTVSLATTWSYAIADPFSFISRLASIGFNYLLFAFFIHLKKQTPDTSNPITDDKEVEKIIMGGIKKKKK